MTCRILLCVLLLFFFFFKQKTAYEMRISDWSSDVCSSDLQAAALEIIHCRFAGRMAFEGLTIKIRRRGQQWIERRVGRLARLVRSTAFLARNFHAGGFGQFLDSLGKIQIVVVHDEAEGIATSRSEEHTSELQSLMRTSYAVFCLQKKKSTPD